MAVQRVGVGDGGLLVRDRLDRTTECALNTV